MRKGEFLRGFNRQHDTGRRRIAAAAAVAGLAALRFAGPASAGTNGTWTNATTGGLWSATSNWSGGVVADGQDGTADFSTLNITADNTVHLDTARTIGNLTFADATTASNNWIVDNNAVAANVLTLSTSTGAPTIAVTNQTATISGNIAGTQGFAKTGAGTLVLSAANTGLSGTVPVTGGGVLRLTNAGALGSVSGVSLDNTATVGGNGTTLDLQGSITVNGLPLSMNSNTASNFRTAFQSSSGSNTWGGAVTLNGTGLDQFNANGGNLTVNGNVSAGAGGFTGILFVRGTSTGTINGTINVPNGGVSKTDNGTWVINSSGNAWGATGVAVGTLKTGAANALPTNTALTIGQGDTSNATLDLNFDQTVASIALNSTGGTKAVTNSGATRRTFTLNNATANSFGTNAAATTGIISGNLNFVKTGAGTLTLGSANTYTGSTTITGGTLALGSASERLPDTTAMSLGGGTFATSGFSETVSTLAMTANSHIDLGSGASVLKYAASNAQTWTGTLTVDNWSGSTAGGGTDQLFFGTSNAGLTSAQLSQINFTGFGTGAQILSTGEVVPVPEPTAAALGGVAVLGLLARRRTRLRRR